MNVFDENIGFITGTILNYIKRLHNNTSLINGGCDEKI